MTCHLHSWGFSPGCEACAHHRANPSPHRQQEPRTAEQNRWAGALVARLRNLGDWNVARYCELILRRHIGPGVDVRQERRRRRRPSSEPRSRP